jgi:hypothetical protein
MIHSWFCLIWFFMIAQNADLISISLDKFFAMSTAGLRVCGTAGRGPGAGMFSPAGIGNKLIG